MSLRVAATANLASAPVKRLRIARLNGLDSSVEAIWRALETDAKPGYFLTWPWIENWLRCVPSGAHPELCVLFDGARPSAAFFLGRARQLRHGFIPTRALFLNVTGSSRWDELCIEHNGFLHAPGWQFSLEDFIDCVGHDWDEIFLPAVNRELFPGSHLTERLPRHRVLIDREVVAPFVDLGRVRAARGGYPELLGANTRAQLRRAMRGFGEMRVELATDVTHALGIYDELVALHEAHWSRGRDGGAFSDPWFYEFHRRLIARRFEFGETQLIRVSTRSETIGCLYNLIAYGHVLFYQSGFASFDDPRKKPGYVCHSIAVEKNAALGHARYDFLGGDARYKHNLSTDATKLAWARIQRPLARFGIENRLRDLKQALIHGPKTFLRSAATS